MELSKEDKEFIDTLIDEIKRAAIVGGEVSMISIGRYVASLPPSTLSNLSRVFGLYGYAGVIPAIRESFKQGSTDPLFKYVLGTLGFMAAVGTGCVNAPAFVIALGIGILVDLSWKLGEYIAENPEEALNKTKDILSAASMLINKNGIISFPLQIMQQYLPSSANGENMCPINPNIKDLFETAEVTKSPLVLDLDGDGVETTGLGSNIFFDHDKNGFSEDSGWVGKDDGILVRDINQNGKIDDGSELFGNNSVLSSGQKAENGFEALKDLDCNNDGIFDANDNAWNEVKVWKDTNQNSKLDDGELLSLEDAGVQSINLGYINQQLQDEHGNQHLQTGTFIDSNGNIQKITDVWFNTDMSNTKNDIDIEIPDDIKNLPNISGSGNVYDLHTAMALDTTGTLKGLVEQFIAETNQPAKQEILLNIIYHWTGVQDMNPLGRNPTSNYENVLGDARKLEALEEFMGREYLGTWCWGGRETLTRMDTQLLIF